MILQTGSKNVTCPTHGPLRSVEVVSYTADGGVVGMHLRARCPQCDQWAKLNGGAWFVSRRMVGLPTRPINELQR